MNDLSISEVFLRLWDITAVLLKTHEASTSMGDPQRAAVWPPLAGGPTTGQYGRPMRRRRGQCARPVQKGGAEQCIIELGVFNIPHPRPRPPQTQMGRALHAAVAARRMRAHQDGSASGRQRRPVLAQRQGTSPDSATDGARCQLAAPLCSGQRRDAQGMVAP
jgi:hypothetical protein